ncbi:uncharacterized protein LOC111916345 [Lactuca sativa]|uniref:Alpha-(1,6)-fucosyltransferase n=1 Tax=Lactuca sativa TaxID=4236 RepID=A0A9R1XNN2_LACSA|nr:uncharacterized protein LOC111916345 [Lactuca sativa]KAJ0219906.1 hypothetical protein LSAT_V11C200089850 [Lactuca sativa]
MDGNGNGNGKSLERMVSLKALQMGNSLSCQICVIGFLCGVCLTSLFLAALTSFDFAAAPNSTSTSYFLNAFTGRESDSKPQAVEKMLISQNIIAVRVKDPINSIYSAWSAILNKSNSGEDLFSQNTATDGSKVHRPPHLENCKSTSEVNRLVDKHTENGELPPWTMWKGFLSSYPLSTKDEQQGYNGHQINSKAAYPPWIKGSDEDNYPLTREVQRDIWVHQHPVNCSDPNVRFLVSDWERIPGFGMGAQFAGMCGLLAIAINEKRVLVTNYYNRADHDGCKGASRSSWSCYFFPETSQECRDRAFELMNVKEAWEKGIITVKENYTTKQIWTAPIPRVWGSPWSYMQPTTEINGKLIGYHRKMDWRWWRAQALRYLMRFQTEYTCGLLNVARHSAFGWEAAELVHSAHVSESIQDDMKGSRSGIEEYVWSNHEPWTPRPLLSVHVRMGDKACEMKVVQFEEYMRLANRIRHRFPDLNRIWLSSEMKEVIDKTKIYGNWKFYYSNNVRRQVGNMTMAVYEASLGRETSTNYPLVNFLMATEADYFIGALGSTWCFLIDGMRNTGGKVMAGYLSVNKDRFW